MIDVYVVTYGYVVSHHLILVDQDVRTQLARRSLCSLPPPIVQLQAMSETGVFSWFDIRETLRGTMFCAIFLNFYLVA